MKTFHIPVTFLEDVTFENDVFFKKDMTVDGCIVCVRQEERLVYHDTPITSRWQALKIFFTFKKTSEYYQEGEDYG